MYTIYASTEITDASIYIIYDNMCMIDACVGMVDLENNCCDHYNSRFLVLDIRILR